MGQRRGLPGSGGGKGNLVSRLANNRITRPVYRSIFYYFARYRYSRSLLNHLYNRFHYPQWFFLHGHCGNVFGRDGVKLEDGVWTLVFAKKVVKLPIRQRHLALDWGLALSILGHDPDVKETYENFLLSSVPPDLFIDIGANYGTHSLLFLIHEIPVMAFEPNVTCHSYFKDVCELNGVTLDMSVAALGEENGSACLRYPEAGTWLGSINGSVQREFDGRGDIVSTMVKLEKLDNYASRVSEKRIVIKLDTEGSECNVLRGAKTFLQTHRPCVIFECWQKHRETLYQLFLDSGYRIKPLPWRPTLQRPYMTRNEFLGSSASNFIAFDQARRWPLGGDDQ